MVHLIRLKWTNEEAMSAALRERMHKLDEIGIIGDWEVKGISATPDEVVVVVQWKMTERNS